MAFCGKCGNQVDEGVKFCPSCGASLATNAPQQAAAQQPAQQAAQQQQAQQQQPAQQQATAQPNDIGAKIAGLNNTADTTGTYDAKDIEDNKFMAVLAYLGLLWLIPFFAKKDSPYVRYHCGQGLTLLVIEVAYSVLSSILRALIKTPYYIYGVYYGSYTPGWLSTVLWIISIPLFILAVIGIVNVVNGKAKELPLIGKIKILK